MCSVGASILFVARHLNGFSSSSSVPFSAITSFTCPSWETGSLSSRYGRSRLRYYAQLFRFAFERIDGDIFSIVSYLPIVPERTAQVLAVGFDEFGKVRTVGKPRVEKVDLRRYTFLFYEFGADLAGEIVLLKSFKTFVIELLLSPIVLGEGLVESAFAIGWKDFAYDSRHSLVAGRNKTVA
ncbi:sugar ABC transporter substrate-binding protein [Halobiforma lacisalsi AJ5]|uniref:Sugar ABC transporter substrate-binding protein n=1 Tax=Natronobacterium lacisalsi AJ5 TaxID=358396 RepID=M0L4N2_NATLA|nr:sugar ABC transporter substrate-binding protein [Halobiforma lacisalsi AJ5]EMA27404.1 hypothetical protein C445_20530 [Halobiforma lacisalsi AJ5]